MIKFLIGGSPCTFWSVASGKNRETKPEGLGWELFLNYLIAKEKLKPDYFLYENNKSVDKSIKAQISSKLGVPLQHINSALVSAQNRERFYAHNFGDVPLPEDRGILLRDILESGSAVREKSHCLDACYYKGGNHSSPHKQSGRRLMVYEPLAMAEKSQTILSTMYKENALSMATRGKAGLFCAYPVRPAAPVRIGKIESNAKNQDIKYDGKAYRVYSPYGKSVTVCGGGGLGVKTGMYACPVTCNAVDKPIYEVNGGLITIKGKEYPIRLPDGFYIIRKLSVVEVCRLQTLPDYYCRAVSNSQAYRALGNSWNAETIIHLLSYALKGVPKNERIICLSMYDGIATGHYCFTKMGYTNIAYYSYEIDKYAKQVAMSNFPDIVQCGDAFQVRENDWFMERAVGAWEKFYKNA